MSITQTMSEDEQYNLEMMQYRLAKLLYDYSINRKTVDEDYIRRVIDTVINGRELVEYVRKYEIVKTFEIQTNEQKNSNPIATYDGSCIKISLEGIEFKIKEAQDTYLHLFPSSLEQYQYINSVITQIILHELEHANQKKIIQTSHNMEARILLYSYTPSIEENIKIGEIDNFIRENKEYIEYLIQKLQKKIDEFYIYAPQERLAEIRSHQQLIDILNSLERSPNRVIKFLYVGKIDSMFRGYEDGIISPTIHYLRGIGNGDILEFFNWYDPDEAKAVLKSKQNYSLEERLIYGLPITNEERDKEKSKMLSTIKHS